MDKPKNANISSSFSKLTLKNKTTQRQTSLFQFFSSNRGIRMDGFNNHHKFYSEDEDSRDSGISCDSNSSCVSESFSSCNSSLDFSNIFNNKQAVCSTSNYDQNSNENGKNVQKYLSGRRTPLKNISNTARCESTNLSSPISRKSSFRSISDRKRTLALSPSFESRCKKLRRIAPDENSVPKTGRTVLHRAYSVSQIETKTFHCDSSPECSYSLDIVKEKNPQDHGFERIQSKILADLLQDFSSFKEKYLLIDCRYPYEYDGGHIKGAINLFDPEKLWEFFYPESETDFQRICSKIPIFYCEFSTVRGPNMANKLRHLDRTKNCEDYPRIDYKQIYVLEKGYRGFFHEIQCKTDQELCSPMNYIQMKAEKFKCEIRKYNFHKKTYTRTQSMTVLSKSYCKSTIIEQIDHTIDEEFEKICSLSSPRPMPRISSTSPLLPFSLDVSPPLNSNFNDSKS